MLKAQQSQLNASDVQAIAGCSRTKAAQIIAVLGGSKDIAGRWTVDARKFYVWYANPARSSKAGGGDHMIIEKILQSVRELSANGDEVSFSLVKKRGSKFWRLRIFGPNRRDKVISLKTADKKQAQNIESEVRSRLNQLALSGVVPYSTSQFFDEWIALKEKEISEGSRKRYQAVIDKLQPFLPNQLYEVGEMHIEQYRDWLIREGYKPESVILELNTIKQIFKKAHRFGYIRMNPSEGVEKPKRPQTTVERYTDAELSAIFEELDRRTREGFRAQSKAAWSNYQEIFFCMYYTGMRVGDVLRLQWENISLPFGTIQIVQQKTRKPALLRIPSEYKARLKALTDTRKAPMGIVYLNTAGSSPTQGNLDYAIRSVLKACDFSKKSPLHSFRHTAAMRLLDAGIPIHEVANQLGDSISTVTKAYLKPQAPTQASVDIAFAQPGQLSRNCPANVRETTVLEVIGQGLTQSRITQKTPKQKGFSVVFGEPHEY